MHSIISPASALCCLLMVSACEAPPPQALGTRTGLQVILDPAVWEASVVFQVHVLKGTTKSGASLTCADIPGNYRVESPQLEQLLKPTTVQKDKTSPTNPVAVTLRVPAEQNLVIVARGLAPYKGTFVVGRGCKDNLSFEPGSQNNTVDIDVRATTGKLCTNPSDCEPNVTCLRGPGFEEGYCAVTGCAGGAQCPPGSACISDTAMSGLCLQLCKSLSDCVFQKKEYPKDCVGRLSLSSSGCDRVCVYPLWQKSNCCPPAACGASDGGV